MIFKYRSTHLTSRRGISSIVGALIFTVLMLAGFSGLSLALNSQSDLVSTHLAVANIELKKQQEQFDIDVFTNSTNFLTVSVDNRGQNPVEISHIWIINKTLTTQPATQFSINSNDAIVPSGFASNVLATKPLKITPNTYDVKVISTLGTMKIAELTSGSSSGALRAKLITDPPDVILGQNVTIAMLVTNTGSSSIQNVVPLPGTKPSQVTCTTHCSSPNPASATLGAGESVLFSWTYTLDGVDGTAVTFSGSATGTLNGQSITSNTSSDVSRLRLDDKGTGSTGTGGTGNSVNADLLARPQLFLTIPGAQGDSPQQALWGVNIANPVNATMTVSKVTITAFAPGANNNDKIFTSGCGPATNLFPVGTNKWNCPSENLIMWEDFTSPITIPPFTVQPFLVKVTPGAIAGVTHLESIVVQASVFTNVGAFGKAGYQTTMYDGADSIGTIYLSNVVDSRTNSDMKITRTGIAPGSTQTFNIVFADLDTDSSTYIKSGGKLVINIPKDWTNVAILNNYGFVTSPAPTLLTHGDGSHQIIATLATNLGSATNQADTIQFSAKAPTVTTDQMYVMYLLAEGESNTNFSIGPLSEAVLQVDAP
ncbi:MAG: hypothetical protein JHC41_00185 [Nitrosopumilus sp.]|nr:hypothetical protein [Nitrosopumilus sp.]